MRMMKPERRCPNTGKKNEILYGIYEENRKLSGTSPQRKRPLLPKYNKSKSYGTFMVLLALFFVLVPAFPDLQHQQVTASSTFSNERILFIPWSEIIYGRQIDNNHIQLSSLLIAKEPQLEVSFDARNLLNYDFLFKNEYARIGNIFGLDIQTIVIDPGHGGKDPGAVGSILGAVEKDIVLDIGLQLRDLLVKSGRFKVLLTRETDQYVSLADRVDFANSNKADLFISLHINALSQKDYNVTETFYFGPPSNTYTLHLAEQENRGSKVLIEDFNNMIKKIGDVLKEQESATLAATIQHSLFANLVKYDRIIADNGTKIAPFVVLLGVDAPSVLVEVSCISKNEEEVNLNDPDYREKVSVSIEKGIINYLTQRDIQIAIGDENGKKKYNKNGRREVTGRY